MSLRRRNKGRRKSAGVAAAAAKNRRKYARPEIEDNSENAAAAAGENQPGGEISATKRNTPGEANGCHQLSMCQSISSANGYITRNVISLFFSILGNLKKQSIHASAY